jgi:tetratricopeptide (TPR) repeat protein
LGAIPRWQAAAGLAERDYGKATYWLGVAQWLGPSDPENALLAARVARHQGKGSELQKQLARAGALGADRERIEREEMLAIVAMGDLVDYESKLIDWMATAGPELPEICDAYVNGLAANGRFAEAGQVLSAWQKDFPNDARCDYRIGRIREHQEAYDKAEQHYRDAISKSERFYAAIFSLARVMQHQRRAEEALQQFTLCFAMPAPEAAKIEAAVALKALGRTDEARNMLLEVLKSGFERQQESYRAVEEQPEGFRAAAEYGRLESDAGNFKAAKPWLVAALDANPLDLTVRYALAVTQRGLGELDAAEANFEHVSKAREAMGAATALNERAQANRNDLEARFLLGKLILEHESERMGLYWIRSILPINPLYRPAHELLAEHYAQKASSEPHYQRLADYHRQQAALSPPTTTADTTPAEPSQP